jgi:hypothetical protein
VSDDGRRCDETGFLEMDHVVPVAQGGTANDGVRVLCRAHNRYEAERMMGKEVVARGRARSEMERDVLSGLRNLGVKRADASAAFAASAGETIEERLRSALRALHGIYARGRAGRCEEAGAVWLSA